MFGNKSFLTIVDNFTRYTCIFPIISLKSGLMSSILLHMLKISFFLIIKTIHTHNDIEFSMHDFFPLKVLFTKLLVLRHLRKMVL